MTGEFSAVTLEEVDRSVRPGEKVVFVEGSGAERLLGEGWSLSSQQVSGRTASERDEPRRLGLHLEWLMVRKRTWHATLADVVREKSANLRRRLGR